MKDAVIVSGARTALGGFGRAFVDYSSAQLGADAIRAALDRAKVDQALVEQVIMGCSVEVTHEINVARSCAVAAGLPVSVPAFTVNQICASGLRAIVSGVLTVKAGEAEVLVAGGTENMSQMPYIVRNARWGTRLENGVIEDSMLGGPLACPFNRYHMGVTAENVQKKYGISREDQDAFALESHRRAVAAMEAGRFKEEIVPINIGVGPTGEDRIIDMDQHPRRDLTMERLASFQPFFSEEGTITVGTASGLNDGAAAVVVMSEDRAKDMGVSPRVKMVSQASVGVEPEYMGIGPVPTVKKALDLASLKLEDIGLIELNEAFAVTTLAVGRELGFDWDKVNVNGGAIALGHPIGATAAILTVKLMYEMARRRERYGMVTACVGGGQGIAAIFENMDM
jgi:acetyl-CoA C-acetyltransferase